MLEWYNTIKDGLEIYPFIIIIGKYDQILGPKEILSSFPIKNEDFVENLLRDALNTTNKYVRLDFKNFYSQICKVQIADPEARGGNQLYAIIILRHAQEPAMEIDNLKRIEASFLSINKEHILKEDTSKFKEFFRRINDIFIKKKEILPIEFLNLQIRTGINTIQGFCELMLEEMRSKGNLDGPVIMNYLHTILESCKEIVNALENNI
jgi:hypothetical protein